MTGKNKETPKKSTYLRIEHINSQSVRSSLDEIEIMIKEREVDILCISETWLEPNVEDKFINIPNFKIFRCDSGMGGGACIYVRDDLQVTLLNSNIAKHTQVEDIWLSIQYKKHPSIIVDRELDHEFLSLSTKELNKFQLYFRLVGCLRCSKMVDGHLRRVA